MATGEVNNLLLRHVCQTIETLHLLLPRSTVDKGIHKHMGTSAVVLQRIIVLQLQVVDH